MSCTPSREECNVYNEEIKDMNEGTIAKKASCNLKKDAGWLQALNPFSKIRFHKNVSSWVIWKDNMIINHDNTKFNPQYSFGKYIFGQKREINKPNKTAIYHLESTNLKNDFEFEYIINNSIEYPLYYSDNLLYYARDKKIMTLNLDTLKITTIKNLSGIKTDKLYKNFYDIEIKKDKNSNILYQFNIRTSENKKNYYSVNLSNGEIYSDSKKFNIGSHIQSGINKIAPENISSKKATDFKLHYPFNFLFDIHEISTLKWPY